MAEQSTTQNNSNGLAVASLVLGIISVPLFLLWFISVPAGILAIIFGAIALKSPGRNMAIAGLVTGCVGISLIVLFVLFAAMVGIASSSY